MSHHSIVTLSGSIGLVLLALLLTSKVDAKSVVKAEQNCIAENSACKIENNEYGSSLLSEYNQTNRVGCFDRCSLNPLCQHWTWWGESDRCQLFNKCRHSPELCKDCLTGPRSCGMQERGLSAISGGLSDASDVPNQNKIYMIDEHKICSQPSIMDALTDMPRSRWGHVSAFIESKFFVCGGTTDLAGSMAPNNTCDVFCVARQEWLEMSDMNANRHSAAGLTLFGKMYVLGGHNGITVTKSVDVYDPSKQVWTESADMPIALKGHCAVAYGDSIIVMGGTTLDGLETASVFNFNVTSNKWRPMKPMLHARSGHGCSLNERPTAHSTPIYEVIVTGGDSAGEILSSTESFDLHTFTWSAFTDLPFNMVNHAQLDIGGPRLYGGDISGLERNLIIQYTDTIWNLANVSLPTDLKFHHVTKYPANLVRC